MKKTKRILALTCAILLIILYGSTLFFALTDHSETMRLFKASIVCTIVLPVLIYAYTLVYRITRKDDGKIPDDNSDDTV